MGIMEIKEVNAPRDYSAIILEMQGNLKLVYTLLAQGKKREAQVLRKRLESLMKELNLTLKG